MNLRDEIRKLLEREEQDEKELEQDIRQMLESWGSSPLKTETVLSAQALLQADLDYLSLEGFGTLDPCVP